MENAAEHSGAAPVVAVPAMMAGLSRATASMLTAAADLARTLGTVGDPACGGQDPVERDRDLARLAAVTEALSESVTATSSLVSHLRDRVSEAAASGEACDPDWVRLMHRLEDAGCGLSEVAFRAGRQLRDPILLPGCGT